MVWLGNLKQKLTKLITTANSSVRFSYCHELDDLLVKNLPANAGEAGWIPGSGRTPRKRK